MSSNNVKAGKVMYWLALVDNKGMLCYIDFSMATVSFMSVCVENLFSRLTETERKEGYRISDILTWTEETWGVD